MRTYPHYYNRTWYKVSKWVFRLKWMLCMLQLLSLCCVLCSFFQLCPRPGLTLPFKTNIVDGNVCYAWWLVLSPIWQANLGYICQRSFCLSDSPWLNPEWPTRRPPTDPQMDTNLLAFKSVSLLTLNLCSNTQINAWHLCRDLCWGLIDS